MLFMGECIYVVWLKGAGMLRRGIEICQLQTHFERLRFMFDERRRKMKKEI